MLEREQAEKKDAESSVNELKRQFGSIKEKCSTADVEIEQYREEVESLRRGASPKFLILRPLLRNFRQDEGHQYIE